MAGKIKNRRRGPDTVVQAINWISAGSWVIILSIFIIVSLAKPRMETMFDRFSRSPVGGSWDADLVAFTFILLLLQLGLCLFGLYLNSMRIKRKSDRYSGTLITFTFLSFFGIIIYFASF